MSHTRIVGWTGVACAALLLSACGGGGGSGGDISPNDPPVSTKSGLDNFLLFPNPQTAPDGSPPINSPDYAQAYYTAIDPGNARDTLAKWKAENGFGSGTGTEMTAVFGDQRDLGYGRRMTARRSPNGSIAFLVENYLANPGGYGFSMLNLEAAILEDRRWLVHVNAIEFSPGPNGNVPFVKFFNFDPVTGERSLTVDIDGRGQKAMPGVCSACHGGRGDGLGPPDATGKRQILIVENAKTQVDGERQPGDVQAQLAPFEAGTFVYSTRAGFTQADQESNLKAMNRLVLCTYPLAIGAQPHSPEDDCRRTAIASEWQGTAATLIKDAYGGDGLPTPSYSEPPVPAAWQGQEILYQNVVAGSCRACHILLGTGAQSDIDFASSVKFQSYAIFPGDAYPKSDNFDDRIKVHVFDRGNMPLAKTVYDAFWGSSNPEVLAQFLEPRGFAVRDGSGHLLQPGRPVADPGPDRALNVNEGPVRLFAQNSLVAETFSWSVVSGPDGAVPPHDITLTNPTSVAPTVTATAIGAYVLRLVVGNASGQSEPALLTLGVVNNALLPPTATLRFADIKRVLQATGGCVTCHVPSAAGALRPPVFFTDTGNDALLYAEVRSRINFTDIAASRLLRKPAGMHHAGANGPLPLFDATKAPGDPARLNYDIFVNWIAAGAPQ